MDEIDETPLQTDEKEAAAFGDHQQDNPTGGDSRREACWTWILRKAGGQAWSRTVPGSGAERDQAKPG
ncbi:Hypothetical predicted protein [Podarcis lilfordi]|uniref:Uncharacterized protein n=1 Tax=Podarcis lilfordi TaxID=74358 RepID=A0AA35L9N6_9SAUR|nr:Hypothetical predicted protein [Podarcis lilfordi]